MAKKHDVNVIIKARDEASKKFGRVGKSALSMGSMIKRAIGMAAVYLGVRQMLRFAKSSLQAFGKQEQAVKSLTDALSLLDKEAQSQGMQAFASDIQKLTTIGDEATLELMSMGASMGKLSGESLKAATVAAIGLSKAFKMDTVAAMRLVARAAQGDTASLTRYGIKLGEGLTTQEKFNKVLEIGAKNFKLAEGETDTWNGTAAQLANTWGDAKEKLGSYIANIPGLRKGMKIARIGIENFGTVMDIVWTKAGLWLVGFWEDAKHLFGVQIPQLAKWFGRNWVDVFKTLWNATKSIFTNMFINIKNFFQAVWSWLKGEGFEFKWTGLLEGFESTLKEMPEIARREMSGVEKALAAELAASKNALRDAMFEGMKESTLDTAELLAKAAAEGFQTGGAKSAGGKGKALAALESRFLGGGAGSDPNKDNHKSLRAIAHTLKQQLKLQERQEQRIALQRNMQPIGVVNSLA